MTREEQIEELLTTDVHGYSEKELERMSDYALRRTYETYESFCNPE